MAAAVMLLRLLFTIFRPVLFASFAGETLAEQCAGGQEEVVSASMVQRAGLNNRPHHPSTTAGPQRVNVDFGGSDIDDDPPEANKTDNAPPHTKVSTAVRPTLVTTEHYNSSLGAWQACATDSSHKSVGDCFTGFGNKRSGDDALTGRIRANSDVTQVALGLHVNCDGTEDAKFLFHLKRMANAIVEVWMNYQILHNYTADKENGHAIKLEIPIDPDSVNEARLVLKPKNRAEAATAVVDIDAYMVQQSFLECMEGKAETDECLAEIEANSSEAKLLRNSQILQKECIEGTSSNSFCEGWKSCLSSSKQQHLLNVFKATMKKNVLALPASTEPVEDDHSTCMYPDSVDPEGWDCDCADNANAACDDMGMAQDDQCYHLLLCQSETVCESWKTSNDCADAQASLLQRRQQRRGDRSVSQTLDDTTRSKSCGDDSRSR